MWSAVEVNVGIICACIPTLKPLIKQFMPFMITDKSRSSTSKTTYASDLHTRDEIRRASATSNPSAPQPLPPIPLRDDITKQKKR